MKILILLLVELLQIIAGGFQVALPQSDHWADTWADFWTDDNLKPVLPPVLSDLVFDGCFEDLDSFLSRNAPRFVFVDPHDDCIGGAQVRSEIPKPVFKCGMSKIKITWQGEDGCGRMSDPRTQYLTVRLPAPEFASIPSTENVSTSRGLNELVYATGKKKCASYSPPVTISWVDSAPEMIACGLWQIQRTFKVAYDLGSSCSGVQGPYKEAEQIIRIRDDVAPDWLSPGNISDEVRIPFFNNYQLASPIPRIVEIAEAKMLELGLTSHPIKLMSSDGPLVRADPKAPCTEALATMMRTWTAMDACGNMRTKTQRIIFMHPPAAPSKPSTELWVAAARKFNMAPGISQRPNGCFPGKDVIGGEKEYITLTGAPSAVEDACAGWWSGHGCREELWPSSQEYYRDAVTAFKPEFDVRPPDQTIFTTDTLDPYSAGAKLQRAQGHGLCSVPIKVGYTDSKPEKQGCGRWTIRRTWWVRPDYADCASGEYPSELVSEHVQIITVVDTAPPRFRALPPAEVHVPFFSNFQPNNSIPLIEDDTTEEMSALGLVSYPTTLTAVDTNLVMSPTSGVCPTQLATFVRTWILRDACGNENRDFQQTIIIDAPSSTFGQTQVWDADERLFSYAPGVKQLDVCMAGKNLKTGTFNYDPLDRSEANDACPAGVWQEDGCRQQSPPPMPASLVDVRLPPPTFTSFIASGTVYTDEPLNPDAQNHPIPKPRATFFCTNNVVITYTDAEPVLEKCGQWTLRRTWTARPSIPGCAAQNNRADLTTTQVQVLTIIDRNPPAFISTPADATVPFLTDYGTSITGVPLVEDQAHSEMAALKLYSYPISLRMEDVTVKFNMGSSSVTEGVAVVTRRWTTQDNCGLLRTWDQTIRIMRTASAWNLGLLADMSIFSTGPITLSDTTVTGNVGSNVKISTTRGSIQNGKVMSDVTPPQGANIAARSDTLSVIGQPLFSSLPNPRTGPEAIRCDGPAQHTCRTTSTIAKPTATFRTDYTEDPVNGALILEGTGQVYNLFTGLDMNRWLCAPPKAPALLPKMVIKAPGFVIIDIDFAPYPTEYTAVRRTEFHAVSGQSAAFVLYNVRNMMNDDSTKKLVLRSCTLAGTLLMQPVFAGLDFAGVSIQGQLIADSKYTSLSNSQVQGLAFAAGNQVQPSAPRLDPVAAQSSDTSAPNEGMSSTVVAWVVVGILTGICAALLVVVGVLAHRLRLAHEPCPTFRQESPSSPRHTCSDPLPSPLASRRDSVCLEVEVTSPREHPAPTVTPADDPSGVIQRSP